MSLYVGNFFVFKHRGSVKLAKWYRNLTEIQWVRLHVKKKMKAVVSYVRLFVLFTFDGSVFYIYFCIVKNNDDDEDA